MDDQKDNSIDELLIWIVSVDRRMVLMRAMQGHNVIKASDIAHETKRTTQNISRALKELENKNLVMCLTPEKSTWKKYILSDLGKEVLKRLENKYL